MHVYIQLVERYTLQVYTAKNTSIENIALYEAFDPTVCNDLDFV